LSDRAACSDLWSRIDSRYGTASLTLYRQAAALLFLLLRETIFFASSRQMRGDFFSLSRGRRTSHSRRYKCDQFIDNTIGIIGIASAI
jgi:hypothetical protein